MRYMVVPGIIATFSVAIIIVALQLDESPAMIVGDSMQPRVFPILLMVINLGLAFFLFLQYRRENPKPLAWEGLQTSGSVALFALFYPLTVYIDMMIAIAIIMFAMCYLWGERRLYVAGAIALATPTAIFFLFDLVLRVRFPRGIFTNWYYG
ncbi:MAG: tripartite tricarboxylate transporter TctB family protein [Alphaproteobacteria bacterium]|jgi:putative tricarboxylic transport membrane protein|nr:tripartite tricarboxylate transporter TctB family protein [Alphaproteobacteria bacterium]